MHMEANSEQRQPVYLGATPMEMELGLPPVDRGHPLLPHFLKPLGAGQAQAIRAALVKKRLVTGLILMDLIGWRAGKDDIFQVNPGDSQPSLRIAAEAFDSVRALKLKFRPKLRSRFDPRSYLYNTDGILFSDAGYPVILFNEHMNRLENLNRVGYHHTTDTSRKIDWEYATSAVKTAIETAARLSCIFQGLSGKKVSHEPKRNTRLQS